MSERCRERERSSAVEREGASAVERGRGEYSRVSVWRSNGRERGAREICVSRRNSASV